VNDVIDVAVPFSLKKYCELSLDCIAYDSVEYSLSSSDSAELRACAY